MELARDEALRLLGEVTFGRMMFISGAMPAVRFVAHEMDGDGLPVGLPFEPETAALLARVWQVVYEADVLDAVTRMGWCVVLTGRAALVEDTDEIARTRERLQPWPGQQVEVVARIHPELVTGFRNAAAGAGAP